MPYVRTGDAKLFYEVHGTGPDLVLLHGGGNNRLVWWRVVPTLAREFRVILADARGHGRSVCAPVDARPRYHADDLLRIMADAGADTASLVCHSMAGLAGLRLAHTEPHRVRSLVLCASPAIRTPETLEGFAAVDRVLEGPDARSAMTDRAFAPGFRERAADIVFLYERLNDLNPPFPRDVLMPGLREVATVPERLEHYVVPTVLIAGDQDQMLPLVTLRTVAQGIPGAELIVLEGVGHTPFLEDPVAFTTAITPWLDGPDQSLSRP